MEVSIKNGDSLSSEETKRLATLLDSHISNTHDKKTIESMMEKMRQEYSLYKEYKNQIDDIKMVIDSFPREIKDNTPVLSEAIKTLEKKLRDIEKDMKKYGKQVAEMGYSLQLFVGGTLIGTTPALNFVAGTGMGISSVFVNGIPKITFTATASAFAGSQEKSTTTPNGVQTTFAFTHTPTVIIWNGAIQTLTHSYAIGHTHAHSDRLRHTHADSESLTNSHKHS